MTITRGMRPARRLRRRRAPAFVAGAVLALGAVVAAQPAVAEEPTAPPPPPDSWVTTTPEGYYRFTIPQADVEAIVGARPAVVELQGNIGPAGTWADLALDPSGANYQGMWGPVPPGVYYYQYTATMPDRSKVSFRNPASPVTVTSQPNWTTYVVPGDSVAWLADAPEAERGAVTTLTYDSAVTGAERSALVWTHPDYDDDAGRHGGPGHHGRHARPVPVLYLLADEGQSAQEWAELGRVPQILDNLAAAGEIEPMVVVMADVNVDDPRAELLRSLVPAVRQEYRVGRDGRQQAVAGIGTGATLALDLMVRDPGTFRSIGSLSGSLDTTIRRPVAHRVNARTDLLRVYVGNVLDPAYNGTEALLRTLESAHVRHQFDGVDPEHGGTWDAWRGAVRDFASRVFDRRSDPAPSEGHLPLTEPYVAPATGSISTPHIDENGIVTFETGTQWADAKDVTVWANWAPNGAWFRIQMEKVGDRWRLALGPLDGFYYYRYVVDGVDQKDPADTVNTLTGVSPLFVPGETDLLLADAPEADRGSVDVLTYDSAVTGTQRNAYVWTPPDYDPTRAEPYPLFVLNHGGGQNWGDWVEVGRAPQILDNLYRQGQIEPMVVVMPDGNVPNYQAELRENVIPALAAGYHISDDPQQRAIAGLSMGGMNSLATWLMYPGEFAYVGAFSGGLFGWPDVDAAAVNAGTTLARIYVGDISDFAAGWVYGTMAGLDERGVEYEFAGPSVGPHGFDVWSANLIDLLPRLFRADTAGTGSAG